MDVDVLVIGGGQAGLGTGYWLSKNRAASFVILDGAARIGQSWRDRWDSLKLFTPRRFSNLPGLRFPRGRDQYPTKDEMADYLEAYAAKFELPVLLDRRVESVERSDGWLEAGTARGVVRGRHLVVATGPFHASHVPAFASRLDHEVQQLHSSNYRNPTSIGSPHVLVVGGGNSAAQLACELADTHQVTVVSPRPFWFVPQSILGVSLYWWLAGAGILKSPAQSRVSRYIRARGDAIIGRELARRIDSGEITFVLGRVVDAAGGEVILENRSRVSASAVLWCTGFRPDYEWLHVAGAINADGVPVHNAGASPAPGLHFVGLPWQTRLNSSLVNGIGHDAHTTVERILDEDAGA